MNMTTYVNVHIVKIFYIPLADTPCCILLADMPAARTPMTGCGREAAITEPDSDTRASRTPSAHPDGLSTATFANTVAIG